MLFYNKFGEQVYIEGDIPDEFKPPIPEEILARLKNLSQQTSPKLDAKPEAQPDQSVPIIETYEKVDSQSVSQKSSEHSAEETGEEERETSEEADEDEDEKVLKQQMEELKKEQLLKRQELENKRIEIERKQRELIEEQERIQRELEAETQK